MCVLLGFWPHPLMYGLIFVISSESPAEANQDAAFLSPLCLCICHKVSFAL